MLTGGKGPVHKRLPYAGRRRDKDRLHIVALDHGVRPINKAGTEHLLQGARVAHVRGPSHAYLRPVHSAERSKRRLSVIVPADDPKSECRTHIVFLSAID